RFLALEVHGSENMREELRLLRAMAFAHGEPEATVLADGLALLARGDLRPALPGLSVPSLWIAGRRDRVVHPDAMRAAAEAAPGPRVLEAQRPGHAPFLPHAGVVGDPDRGFA